MKNRKSIIIAAVGVFIILAVVVTAVFLRSCSQGTPTEISSQEEQTGDGSSSQTDFTAENRESETEPTSQGREETRTEAAADSSTSSGGSTNTPIVILPTERETAASNLSFPYSIPDSGLVITGLASYDGIYLEDGSDAEIAGVTVMILENRGDTAVEYADITLKGEGEILRFQASAIPAKATAVVQEANRASYKDRTYTQCQADIAVLEFFEMSQELVSVTDNGDNSLTVTNLTDEVIPAVRIFYKFYMEEEDVYVGGIAYTAKLTDLNPGASQNVVPSHFASEGSRVIMVRTYETQD